MLAFTARGVPTAAFSEPLLAAEEQTGSAGRIDRRKEFREEMQAERSSGGISEWDSKGNDFALHPEGISSQNVLRYRCRCAV